MELIKKIKQAETEAQEIVEQAKADAVVLADKGRQTRRQRLEESELQRKKTIDAAVEKARAQAQVEVKTLKTRAEQERRQLRDHVKGKVPAAVAKVADYLRKG
jgi:V/A-type H+-transporting ATPase subunit G/H